MRESQKLESPCFSLRFVEMHKACHFWNTVARLVQALIVNDEVYQALPSHGSKTSCCQSQFWTSALQCCQMEITDLGYVCFSIFPKARKSSCIVSGVYIFSVKCPSRAMMVRAVWIVQWQHTMGKQARTSSNCCHKV